MKKRDFLKTGFWAGLATTVAISPVLAQTASRPAGGGGGGNEGKLPSRNAKTTRLFKAPGVYPNAMSSSPQGLWVAQQLLTESEAQDAGIPYSRSGKEKVWLLDMSGKVLQTRESSAINTSGLAVGGGSLWVCSNTSDAATGIHQVDIASGKQTAQRQIPLSPNNVSGGNHGAKWHQGKLWVANNRMRSIMRINPQTWQGEMQIPIAVPPDMGRFHDFAFDRDGTLLIVIANQGTKSHTENKAGLLRVDPNTGRAIETIIFAPGSADPHGLEFHNGQLLSCDAGYHPGWKNYDSPNSQWVFSIDIA